MTELVTLTEPQSAATEAYRTLRTNLAFNHPERSLRSVLVTSPTAAEDRATVAANLAVVTASAGRTVVALDADLRRPALHTLFGVANDRGLAQALAGDGAPALLATAVPTLRILPAGPTPADPASLLDGPATARLLDDLRAEADVVIVCAPPVLAVADAAVLAPLVDGVVLVVASGRSRRDDARAAREALDRVGARVLGVVLTDAESVADHRY